MIKIIYRPWKYLFENELEKNGKKCRENLNHFQFADDISLMSESLNELQEMQNGLNRKWNKSNVQLYCSEKHHNSRSIREIQEYIYLGQLITLKKRPQKIKMIYNDKMESI